MFGYVTPLKGELKVKDYERFKCYYCGLCIHIKKHFGNMPRMVLNYDMTFLGVLLDGINPDDVNASKHVCMLHPTQKKVIISNNKALSYAAAMNISLAYYKFIDDVNDDKTLSGSIKSFALSPYKKKFSKDIQHINKKISACLYKLSVMETNKNFTSIDEICDPFSNLVAIILKDYPYALKDDCKELRNYLYNLGYSLGKWIYLIDALDDLEDDMKKNKFNPINYLYNSDNLSYNNLMELIRPRIEFTILNCGYAVVDNFKKINFIRNKDIIQNTIELGLMDKYLKIINKTSENKGVNNK